MATPAEQKIFASTHSDYFLKIDGIKGESLDSKHKDEINVLHWHVGAAQPGVSALAGQGAGAGKVQFRDFQVTKYVDASTPKLMQACASGQHFPSLTFTARRAGGTQSEYLTIKLTNVIVSSYESNSSFAYGENSAALTASGSKEIFPVDTITMNFAKIDMTYKAQLADGSTGGSTAAGWDLQGNVKT